MAVQSTQKHAACPGKGGGEIPEHPCAGWAQASAGCQRCPVVPKFCWKAMQLWLQGLAPPGLPPPRSPCSGSQGGDGTSGGACAPQATQCQLWTCSKEGFTPSSGLFPSSSWGGNGCRRTSPLLSVLRGFYLLPSSAPGSQQSWGPAWRIYITSLLVCTGRAAGLRDECVPS